MLEFIKTKLKDGIDQKILRRNLRWENQSYFTTQDLDSFQEN